MRIAWCTPLHPASAIGGRFSRPVVEALRAGGAEVDLWHPPTSAPEPADPAARPLTEHAWAELADYDLVVHNVGNHAPNHGAVVQAARAVPGVVVLHDLVLHHLWYGMTRDDLPTYLRMLDDCSGPDAVRRAAAAERGLEPALVTLPEVVDHPLFEPVLPLATAVVVHSLGARDAVRRRFLGPVAAVPLAYVAPRAAEAGKRPAGEHVTFVTVGHVNPNKQVETVVRALAVSEATRARARYVVCGPVDDAATTRLRDLARSLRVELVLTGSVDDDELHEHLRSADVSVNLRRPVLETGSASLVEAMLYSLPTVVAAAGAYADVPDDCGLQVPADCPVDDVADALRRLVDDPALRLRMGHRAREHARAVHDPVRYAKSLLALHARRGEELPVRQLTAALGERLRAVGASPDGVLARRAAAVAAELFGTAGEGPAGRAPSDLAAPP